MCFGFFCGTFILDNAFNYFNLTFLEQPMSDNANNNCLSATRENWAVTFQSAQQLLFKRDKMYLHFEFDQVKTEIEDRMSRWTVLEFNQFLLNYSK